MTALPTADRGCGPALPLLVVASAAGLALGAPLWTLLLGPILFGVPHVVGDLRVLWLQRPAGLDGRTALAIAVPVAALTFVRLAAAFGLDVRPRVELACGVVAIAIGGFAGAVSRNARLGVGLASLLLLVPLLAAPALAAVSIAHVHNLVAVAWFVALAGRAAIASGIAFAAGLALVALSGAGPESATAASLSWTRCCEELAPGLDAALADRLVRAFAFAQVVHYGLWTFVLPNRRGHSLRTDLGALGLRASVGAAVFVPLLALVDANGARTAYLSLAIGHGWFEFAIAAFVLARRGSRT